MKNIKILIYISTILGTLSCAEQQNRNSPKYKTHSVCDGKHNPGAKDESSEETLREGMIKNTPPPISMKEEPSGDSSFSKEAIMDGIYYEKQSTNKDEKQNYEHSYKSFTEEVEAEDEKKHKFRTQRNDGVLSINKKYNWMDYFKDRNKGGTGRWGFFLNYMDKTLSQYDADPFYSPSEQKKFILGRAHNELRDKKEYKFNIDDKEITIHKANIKPKYIKNRIKPDEYNKVDYYRKYQMLWDETYVFRHQRLFSGRDLYNNLNDIHDPKLLDKYYAAFCGGMLYISLVLYLQATEQIDSDEAYLLLRHITRERELVIGRLPSDSADFHNLANLKDEKLDVKEHLDYYYDYYSKGAYDVAIPPAE